MPGSKHDQKVSKVMGEFKAGTLRSSSGELVTDRKQAMAIALSEAGRDKKAAAPDPLNATVAKAVKVAIAKVEAQKQAAAQDSEALVKLGQDLADAAVGEHLELIKLGEDLADSYVQDALYAAHLRKLAAHGTSPSPTTDLTETQAKLDSGEPAAAGKKKTGKDPFKPTVPGSCDGEADMKLADADYFREALRNFTANCKQAGLNPQALLQEAVAGGTP